MGLVASLLIVFLVFCLLMAGVLAFCLHERRKIDGLGSNTLRSGGARHAPEETPIQELIAGPTDETDDNRVAMVLFGTIVAGALLALITGYLVFFRAWN
jgi:hypothetical protein